MMNEVLQRILWCQSPAEILDPAIMYVAALRPTAAIAALESSPLKVAACKSPKVWRRRPRPTGASGVLKAIGNESRLSRTDLASYLSRA
jgi:hypothetical protein